MRQLRGGTRSVLARVGGDRVILDLRSVLPRRTWSLRLPLRLKGRPTRGGKPERRGAIMPSTVSLCQSGKVGCQGTRVRLRHDIMVSTLVALASVAWPLAAEEAGFLPQHHPWGSAKAGAWKIVRITTEGLDEAGRVASSSTAETMTTLRGIDAEGVTLDVEACVQMSGKQFEPDPQSLRQGYHGESLNPRPKIKELAAGQVVVEGRKIPCRVFQLERVGQGGKTVTTVHYSSMVAPYVLRRESTTTDPDGKTLSETNAEVMAVNMPFKTGGDTKDASLIRTVQRQPAGSVLTWAFSSASVPGGIVCTAAAN